MQKPTYTVLFLCQENAGRSLMAEAMLNKLGGGRFTAYSAGIMPAHSPNPIAIEILKEEGFETHNLQPKPYRLFLEEDVPKLDFVFTLCADSKQEAELRIWNELSHDTITAHWHFTDPSMHASDQNAEREALKRVQLQIAQRIRLFITLPDEKLKHMANDV